MVNGRDGLDVTVCQGQRSRKNFEKALHSTAALMRSKDIDT
jgi:hypothetical protein